LVQKGGSVRVGVSLIVGLELSNFAEFTMLRSRLRVDHVAADIQEGIVCPFPQAPISSINSRRLPPPPRV